MSEHLYDVEAFRPRCRVLRSHRSYVALQRKFFLTDLYVAWYGAGPGECSIEHYPLQPVHQHAGIVSPSSRHPGQFSSPQAAMRMMRVVFRKRSL